MAISSIQNIPASLPEVGAGSLTSLGGAAESGKSTDFQELVFKGINDVNHDLVKSEKISQEFMTGQKHNLHEVMISLEQADLSFRYMTTIRNKVLDAYSEVMRMQV